MIREICKDEAFLAQKAEPAAADDLVVAQDLLDTLTAHKDGVFCQVKIPGFAKANSLVLPRKFPGNCQINSLVLPRYFTRMRALRRR